MAKQLKDNVWIRLAKQVTFQFLTKCCERRGKDWTSTGRLFQSRGPAAANERSPTVTSRNGRTSSRLEVDERIETHVNVILLRKRM